MLNHKLLGSGPPLVVLHGLFGSLDNWQTLARRWAEDFTVVLVDQRNHGKSFHAEEMDYPVLARDLAEFLEEQWIHECYLLGHSMGGKTAMQTALSYPGLVSKLIVVDMAPRAYAPGHDEVFRALRGIDPAGLGSRAEAETQMAALMPDPGVRQFLLKNLARDKAGGYRWKMNLEVLDREYGNLIGPVGQGADPFGEPALFVRGGRSDYVTAEDEPEIERLFPAAEVVTVAGAGHWVHAEAGEEMYGLVREFCVR